MSKRLTSGVLRRIRRRYEFRSDGVGGDVGRLLDHIEALEEVKDNAYAERNRCVAAIAALALRLGWTAGLGRHVGEDWEDDWRNIVFIDLPAGQVSWHIHDSELSQFAFLPSYAGTWDGHSADEKYERLAALTATQREES